MRGTCVRTVHKDSLIVRDNRNKKPPSWSASAFGYVELSFKTFFFQIMTKYAWKMYWP